MSVVQEHMTPSAHQEQGKLIAGCLYHEDGFLALGTFELSIPNIILLMNTVEQKKGTLDHFCVPMGG